jgi:glycine/D-amino acid oxidase-like deaminating enzyme
MAAWPLLLRPPPAFRAQQSGVRACTRSSSAVPAPRAELPAPAPIMPACTRLQRLNSALLSGGVHGGATSTIIHTPASNSSTAAADELVAEEEEVMDTVVIGGGFLGLTTLAQLRHGGYRACLVTESLVGEGQSLHSHGWFHAGYLPGTVADARMWREESARSEAMVARLGAGSFLRAGRAFRAVQSGAAADNLVAQAAEIDVPLRRLAPGQLPGVTADVDGHGGSNSGQRAAAAAAAAGTSPLSRPSSAVFEMREWLFAKEKLAALLAKDHAGSILTNSAAVGFEYNASTGGVDTVVLSTGKRLRTRTITVTAVSVHARVVARMCKSTL